ncbi:helix-turn-helix domain-containing protein [Phaeobacter gallaeciensis]|uniref:Helix-turn-helix domain protein n=1 Tax=Phaeobacter gallaeciensis TaxID=60890 RepID=A0AAC9Z4V2_9RHOB|nr:helix-turn-helix domain-containing protein [Phaeobacter gallaeciensis]AHD07941.1 Helix-turn-helix domain protein [Phaeobacter gallaeciensis DSM 26640]ATE91209.1 Helix-turn-helix domain protein [Phaeobacter gallaeciensis]ATE95484.1 Helix-turn-helix domain protein [Phaeobacter gallaeciensis]ATE99823.1 Helix-turn-helix domain protein [Phaeobacter gallaeciensis]ATF04256.1 Helix-turn-helix domain protein [Phaeobacter gallaeciensis]
MQKVTLYSPRELAEISGWPEKRIRNLIASGDLKHVKIGSNYFTPEDAIDDFLHRNMVAPETSSIAPRSDAR